MAFHHVAITTRDLGGDPRVLHGGDGVRARAGRGRADARSRCRRRRAGPATSSTTPATASASRSGISTTPSTSPTDFDPSISRGAGPPAVDEPPRVRRSRPRHARGPQAALDRRSRSPSSRSTTAGARRSTPRTRTASRSSSAARRAPFTDADRATAAERLVAEKPPLATPPVPDFYVPDAPRSTARSTPGTHGGPPVGASVGAGAGTRDYESSDSGSGPGSPQRACTLARIASTRATTLVWTLRRWSSRTSSRCAATA